MFVVGERRSRRGVAATREPIWSSGSAALAGRCCASQVPDATYWARERIISLEHANRALIAVPPAQTTSVWSRTRIVSRDCLVHACPS
jgi:hypothetical protein